MPMPSIANDALLFEGVSNTNQWLLNSLLGETEEGIIIAIINSPSLDLNLKIDYLRSAISESCNSFNTSLDKLNFRIPYSCPDRLDVIRYYKLINDLYFNNEILHVIQSPALQDDINNRIVHRAPGDIHNPATDFFLTTSVRPALNHYFGIEYIPETRFCSDASVTLLGIYQPLIQRYVQAHLEKLNKTDIMIISSSTRIDTSWRTELKLPATQRLPLTTSRDNLFRQRNRIVFVNRITLNPFEKRALHDLADSGLNEQHLKVWQGEEEFSHAHYTALVFLIRELHATPFEAITEINFLTAEQATAIPHGLSGYEVQDLNAHQIQSLRQYCHMGIISDHLRGWQTEFTAHHSKALEYLICSGFSSESATMRLRSSTLEQVQELCSAADVEEAEEEPKSYLWCWRR
jgi:hypothetical protein